MKKLIIQMSLACACTLFAASAAYSQDHKAKTSANGGGVSSALLKGAAKVPVIVVGSAAKAGWEITKFTAVRVAKPAAKALIVKATPRATVFLLKNTGVTAKYLLPLAVKLSVL
jgi:hypothetical protein